MSINFIPAPTSIPDDTQQFISDILIELLRFTFHQLESTLIEKDIS